jgi:hypothetical protein
VKIPPDNPRLSTTGKRNSRREEQIMSFPSSGQKSIHHELERDQKLKEKTSSGYKAII